MRDLYLPPLNLETDEDKERFRKKLRGELPSYNGTANYRLFISAAVNPNFYSKGQESNDKRSAAAKREHERWRAEADRIRQQRAKAKKEHLNDSEVARRVKNRLALLRSVDHIRKQIQPCEK
jgi:hypothetical protein